MRNLKRLLSLTLALALVFTFVGFNESFVGARADSFDQSLVNQFTDIKGHWANEGLTNLIGYGYMHGVGDYQAAPNETLTTAQLVALLVRIMGGSEEADLSGYVDMDKGAWYYSEIAQGLNMGIIPNTNTNYINPNQHASREYAAYMLCRAFGLTVRAPLDDFADADKVSDWAVSSMQAMVAADAIVGTSGHSGRNLNPQETITRAEFAQMVYRLCKDFVKLTDSTNIRKQNFAGGLLVSRSGVTIRDSKITGNLYVADAVGTGDITLENTEVTGNIYVRGCGERSVHLEGTTKANSVVFINPYNATRLVVEDEAVINGVLVNNGMDEVTLEGKVGNVTLNVSDVDLTFEKAEASTVIINSARSTVTVDKDSVVETLSVASSSSGVTVDSKGKIDRLAQMANDATLKLDGTLDYLLIGAVSDLKLSLDSGIKLGALDLHCSNSTIDVDSEVKSISVSAFSDKLKLNLGKNANVVAVGIASASTDLTVHEDAKVGAVTLDAPKYKGTISSDLASLIVGAGAIEADVTLGKGTDIATLTIYASKVKLTVEDKANVKDIVLTGTDCEISGSGVVEAVNVATTASGTKVSVPGTKVANAGAEKVTAGGIEVPANKTYTVDSSGKNVIRNNDGTPDGDGDKTTGADSEVATVANFELAFANAATPSDIHDSGKWALDDLCTGVTLTKNTAGTGATYKLTGNVKKVDNFTPVHDVIAGYGTGYYVPVVLTADSMATEPNWTAEVNGFRYDQNRLSKGTGLNGKLIVYVQLQSGITNKVTYVTFDRDGAGTNYTPVTVSIDYSAVTFDGAQDLTGEVISYPVNATKSDLTTGGVLELADFGTFNVAKAGVAQTYQVTGSAKYITAEVKGNTGTATDGVYHYLPLMINTSSFKPGWVVVLDDGTRFNSANVSRGDGCRGNLVLLLPLASGAQMNHTIYFDANGDGRTDDNGVYTINCVGVTLGTNGGGGDNPGPGPGPNPDFDPNAPVEIPTGLVVDLNAATGVITVIDEGDVFGGKWDASKAEHIALAKQAVCGKLQKEGYTDLTLNGSDPTLYFAGNSSTDQYIVFTLNLNTGVLIKEEDITVTYKADGSAATFELTLPAGSTVATLVDLAGDNLKDKVGYFYSKDGKTANTINKADQDVLADGDVIQFGYCLIVRSQNAEVKGGGAKVTLSDIPSGPNVLRVEDPDTGGIYYYALLGTKLTVGVTVAPSEDGVDLTKPFVFKFKTTNAAIAFETPQSDAGYEVAADGNSLTFTSNAGIASVAKENETVTITTAAGTLTEFSFGVSYNVSISHAYSLAATDPAA